MASSHMKKFDPADHPGCFYDAFCEFVDSFAYEYAAIAKAPPAGTTDVNAWSALDKRKQFLGKYASRNLQKDLEDEATTQEINAFTFDEIVTKLKARYKPSQNVTMAHYEFHKIQQRSLESFDMFVNRVKHEASFCDFKCDSPTCTVRDTLIRDRVIVGTTEDEVRKNALKDQWELTELQTKGRKIEAATLGADKIKKECKRYWIGQNKL